MQGSDPLGKVRGQLVHFFFYPFYDQYHAKKGLMGSTAVKEREGVNLLEL